MAIAAQQNPQKFFRNKLTNLVKKCYYILEENKYWSHQFVFIVR